jgi:transcriptional regulator with XRE-family HTH domain
MTQTLTFGNHLRDWRLKRRMSQLDLALEAEISTRHLSFLETGRAAPSREMLLKLAVNLDLPLRDRNSLLLAAGYAPLYPQRPLEDPASATARGLVETLVKAHEPFPALAVDLHWNLVMANAAVAPLVASAAPALLASPVNVLRLALHPEGLAPYIENLSEWRAHLMARLRRQMVETGDRALRDLATELAAYPGAESHEPTDPAAIATPLKIRVGKTKLNLISTVMVFGAAREVTLSELAIETFLPADQETREALRRLCPAAPLAVTQG